MINRVVLGAVGLLVAVSLAALAVQSVRLVNLRTELAGMGRELGDANARAALLEESEKALLAARDALTGQIGACQQTNAQSQVRTVERTVIARNAKPVPAQKGKVVDDATSRRAAVHLNGACR